MCCCAAAGAQALPAASVAALLRQALSCVSHPLSRLESFRFLLSLPAAGSMDQATLAGVLQATLQVRECVCLYTPGDKPETFLVLHDQSRFPSSCPRGQGSDSANAAHSLERRRVRGELGKLL